MIIEIVIKMTNSKEIEIIEVINKRPGMSKGRN
jgi:hypothetical protein